MDENEASHIVIASAIEVHRELGGPGLLEDIYEEALAEELILRGLRAQRQKSVPINYKGRFLAKPLRLDLLVEENLIVEAKAVAEWNSIFTAQMLTYLRLTKIKLGLIINFGERLVKDGVVRVVNNL